MIDSTATKPQISAGGVAFRLAGDQIQVALISVGEQGRWQLPKGMLKRDESPKEAALREVREEAGIETEVVAYLDRVEFWYYGHRGSKRLRFHKFVHLYLLRYLAGDVKDHDDEVNEARWVDIDSARAMLSFSSERKVVEQAQEMLAGLVKTAKAS